MGPRGIVAALQKGRARVAATRTPADAASLADDARLSPMRRTLFCRGSPSRSVRRRAVLLADRAALARPAMRCRSNGTRWLGQRPCSSRLGCLCLQMLDPRPVDEFAGRWGTGMKMTGFPDLNLRLAELLTELHMPASLLAPVLASASLDFVNSAVTRDQDDQRGHRRSSSRHCAWIVSSYTLRC